MEDMEDVGEVLELCLQLWHRFGFLDCSWMKLWSDDSDEIVLKHVETCWNMLKAVTKQWRCAQRQLSLYWQFKTRKKNEDKKIAVVLSWQLLVRTPVRSSAFQPGPEAQFETQIGIEEDWGFQLTCLDSRLWSYKEKGACLPPFKIFRSQLRLHIFNGLIRSLDMSNAHPPWASLPSHNCLVPSSASEGLQLQNLPLPFSFRLLARKNPSHHHWVRKKNVSTGQAHWIN